MADRYDQLFSGPDLFDLEEGKRRKERGMTMSAQAKADLLHLARSAARQIAVQQGDVTADDVAQHLTDKGLPMLGASAGSLFRGPDWEFTGDWRASSRVTNHARQNRVWRLA